jgi:type II restriction/modification system DNA methylase subunit YeeA
MNPQQFVMKWQNATLRERAAAQEHFIDLCRLIEHPTPAEDDPTGERFTFEAGATKQAGGQGWADVWKRGYFAWEYKGKHADLQKAYRQLLQYRESLQNPPLLIVSDIDKIIVHTNFTNTVKREVTITLDDLLTPEGMRRLRAIFYEPEAFRTPQTTEQVTREAASEFARLAEHLRHQGHEPPRIAHFLIRLLFCLFSEDIGLLPKALFTRLVDSGRRRSAGFNQQLQQLFGAMATGGFFGEHEIRHFNGGLFDSSDVLDLDRVGLDIVYGVSSLDWASIEPSIFGTLFERSLDPSKRSQLGAHYTSREDILLIVEPVLMAPLRRRWATVQDQARELARRRDEATDQSTRTRRQNELNKLLFDFAGEIARTRVLDPACGSGNFLYVALKQLLDLEKEVSNFAADIGANRLFPQVNPEQLYGIEINEYAYELAQATVWIGYIQWLHENGFGIPAEPILKPLNNIKHMDAILAYDAEGRPVEPDWPEANIIIGNPPFLGGKRLRTELGVEYVDDLFKLYENRVPRQADLVAYWFERARSFIESGVTQRSGLIATQAIRAGATRQILERIIKTCPIFMGWSDRPWVLDGASVRVSIVGFGLVPEQAAVLDGEPVHQIYANLSGKTDVTQALQLKENRNVAFQGIIKVGPFELDNSIAQYFLTSGGNPNGRPNSDVVKPWVNANDVTSRHRNMWIIDFGTDMPLEVAAQYEMPFQHVETNVRPQRALVRRKNHRERWWLFGETRPGMRRKLKRLNRYIATPRVAKHRTFVFLGAQVVPDARLFVFTRQDDYFFGVLHSHIHEVWSLATSSRHGDGDEGGRPTYNNTTCFETFPFPWPPGKETQDDPRVQAIAQAAKELVEKRDAWLNPPSLSEAELKKRTLTNLYNQRPTWLDLAHKKLDAAVFAAYGWPADLSDEEILARLLALNLERARSQGKYVDEGSIATEELPE